MFGESFVHFFSVIILLKLVKKSSVVDKTVVWLIYYKQESVHLCQDAWIWIVQIFVIFFGEDKTLFFMRNNEGLSCVSQIWKYISKNGKNYKYIQVLTSEIEYMFKFINLKILRIKQMCKKAWTYSHSHLRNIINFWIILIWWNIYYFFEFWEKQARFKILS